MHSIFAVKVAITLRAKKAYQTQTYIFSLASTKNSRAAGSPKKLHLLHKQHQKQKYNFYSHQKAGRSSQSTQKHLTKFNNELIFPRLFIKNFPLNQDQKHHFLLKPLHRQRNRRETRQKNKQKTNLFFLDFLPKIPALNQDQKSCILFLSLVQTGTN